jgi:hypothetical protein
MRFCSLHSLDAELEIVIARLPEGLRLNIPALRFAIGRDTRGDDTLYLSMGFLYRDTMVVSGSGGHRDSDDPG